MKNEGIGKIKRQDWPMFKKKSKAASKTPQDSTRIEPLGKDCTYLDYMSDNSGRLFPEKDNWRQRLIHTMFEWTDGKDSWEIEQFCKEYKIPRTTLYFWRDKYPDIRKAIDEVKLILASSRRIGALTKRLDKDVVFKDIHKYDSEWLEINQYNAKLKDQEQGNEKKVVVLESMCSHEDHK
ncbi:MAG TPA: hypothetical protein VNX68_09425 [Nitrosopumilaceae archaeon]|jgi:hypothetical protein|nr:hypothetical protein [Nitrosopumilaceae archaeon]